MPARSFCAAPDWGGRQSLTALLRLERTAWMKCMRTGAPLGCAGKQAVRSGRQIFRGIRLNAEEGFGLSEEWKYSTGYYLYSTTLIFYIMQNKNNDLASQYMTLFEQAKLRFAVGRDKIPPVRLINSRRVSPGSGPGFNTALHAPKTYPTPHAARLNSSHVTRARLIPSLRRAQP